MTVMLNTLPSVDAMLAEDPHTPPNSQISQEALQGAAYRLRTLR
jgi:hypothetical protein